MELNESLDNGSIPIMEIKDIEQVLNNKYWYKFLVKYAEENELTANIELMKKMKDFKENGCLDIEHAEEIYNQINQTKLEELLNETDIQKIKETLENKTKEEVIENTLFEEVYKKMYDNFQELHWNKFQEYSLKEDEKIHFQDAVEIINMLELEENPQDKKDNNDLEEKNDIIENKEDKKEAFIESPTLMINGKDENKLDLLLLEHLKFESQHEEKKFDHEFFKEWTSVCVKLFKRNKLRFQDVIKVITEALSLKPKDAFLLRKKGVAYSKESVNLLKKMAEDNKKTNNKLQLFSIPKKDATPTLEKMDEKMEFDLLFRESIYCFESSQKEEKNHKLYENWGYLYFSRAHCCDILEETKKAIDCYFEGIKYFEKSFIMNKKYEKAIYNWGKSIDRICSYKLSSSDQKEASLTLAKYLKFFKSFSKSKKKVDLKPLIALVYSDHEIVQKLNPIDTLWKIAKISPNFSVRLEATKQVLYVGNLLKKIPPELDEFFKYSRLPMENTMGHVNILVNCIDWYISHIIKKKKTEKDSTEDSEVEEDGENTDKTGNKEDVLKVFESKINSLFIQENPTKYYKMESTIGSGGFGTVWTALELSKEQIEHGSRWSFRSLLASRSSSSTTVAIKVFSRNLIDDCAHIIKEIEIMKSCKHENIVRYIKSFLHTGKAYVVMEYCDGGSLNDMEKQVIFAEPEISYVVSRVLAGLEYLHSHELVHRDIKPDNLLFNIDGSVRVGDLGLVTSEKLTINNKQICGTYYYMSPEQISKTGYTSKTDIWSLGITIREMMEKDPPYFNKNKIYAMYYTAVKGVDPVKESEKWSSSLIDFLDNCLCKDYGKRESAKNLLQHNFMNLQCTRGRMKQLCELTFLGNALNLMGL